jgi:autotransporter-associated beta strand protein
MVRVMFHLLDAVGGTGGLNGLTISTNHFNAVALTVGGTISITNTGTSSEITGVIANDTDAAVFTKAGTGTLTLSGTNTYTGITTISAGTLSISADAGSWKYFKFRCRSSNI